MVSKSTGTQRQHSRLAQKRVLLDKLFVDTPRIYPDTRQIRRQEARDKAKELLQLAAKELRKKKRNKNKSGDTPPAV